MDYMELLKKYIRHVSMEDIPYLHLEYESLMPETKEFLSEAEYLELQRIRKSIK